MFKPWTYTSTQGFLVCFYKWEEAAELSEAVSFLSAKYDELKRVSDESKANFAKLQQNVNMSHAENIYLKGMIDDLEQEKVHRNTESQYWRTCFNLKLCGIPIQTGEEIKSRTPTNLVTCEVMERVC